MHAKREGQISRERYYERDRARGLAREREKLRQRPRIITPFSDVVEREVACNSALEIPTHALLLWECWNGMCVEYARLCVYCMPVRACTTIRRREVESKKQGVN